MTASDLIGALRSASPDELREIAEILFVPLQVVGWRGYWSKSAGATLRANVGDVVRMLLDGRTVEEVMRRFPELTEGDIMACWGGAPEAAS